METTNWLTVGLSDVQLQTEKWETLISAAIELRMKELNLSSDDLSTKLCKSKRYVRKILSGNYKFNIQELVEICECLDCNLAIKFLRKRDIKK